MLFPGQPNSPPEANSARLILPLIKPIDGGQLLCTVYLDVKMPHRKRAFGAGFVSLQSN